MRALMIVTLMLGVGCQGEDAAAKRAAERLKQVEAEKAEKKRRSAEFEAQREKAMKGAPTLGSPWDDAKLLVPDSPCPVGLWSLFPSPPPPPAKGEEPSTEADRAPMANALKAETYMVKLRAPDGASVVPIAGSKGEVGVEVKGSIECTDHGGRVLVAWTAPKAGAPGSWVAPPILLPVPTAMASAVQPGHELLARVAFKLSRGEEAGGARLLHADLIGVRVAADTEQSLVVEKKGPP
jgi:hypothetical protein